jgi:hypothetical protein
MLQAVGGELDFMVLIGGPEEWAAIYCLPHIRLPKTLKQYTFTLKMSSAVLSETLDNSQHSKRLIPESRSYTLSSSRENLRQRMDN